jgi:hypothetical protein
MDKKTEAKIDELKTKNLADGGKFNLDRIPVKKFFDQAQYIERVLLPKIKQSRGELSGDYNFFCDVYRSLLYAVMIVDRGDQVNRKLARTSQLLAFYRQASEDSERELLKYTTIEDLFLTDGMDKIAADIKRRVEELLK